MTSADIPARGGGGGIFQYTVYTPTVSRIGANLTLFFLYYQVFVGCEGIMANGCVLGPVGTSQAGRLGKQCLLVGHRGIFS
jgi:hypothetical protein